MQVVLMAVRQLLKKMWYSFFRDQPLTYAGRVLVHVVPADYIESCRENLISKHGPKGLLASIIKSEINRQYYALSDEEKMQWNRERLWGGRRARSGMTFKQRRFRA